MQAMPTLTTQVEICPQLISPDDLKPDKTSFSIINFDDNGLNFNFKYRFHPLILGISKRFLYFQNPWMPRITMVPVASGFIQY